MSDAGSHCVTGKSSRTMDMRYIHKLCSFLTVAAFRQAVCGKDEHVELGADALY